MKSSIERTKTVRRQPGEKIMMQQRSTEQRSTVDARRHLTNFKMLVSHSMSALLLNQVFKLSSGTWQQLLRMLSKSVTFLDFHKVV